MARKNKKNTRKQPAKTRNKPGFWSRFFRISIRCLAWIVLFVFLALSTWGLGVGFHHLFFANNPHFTIKSLNIDIYGDINESQVRRFLEENNVILDQTNLFDLDLGKLHRAFTEWKVPVKHVRLMRRLPKTLAIRIFEHEPVAQLRSPGNFLVDTNAMVLPPQPRRNVRYLPIITPVRGTDFKTGLQLDDTMLNAALFLLAQIAREREYNELLNPRIIALDYESHNRLTVILRARGPFCEGAKVVLPADEKKMKKALRRVKKIAAERLNAKQITGFIDATYEVNIPVRRTP